MNVQMAVKDEEVYILEVNPRASRTVPFVAKAKGVPWARLAAKVMMGASLEELGVDEVPDTGFYAREGAGLPVRAFPGRRRRSSARRCARPARSWAWTARCRWPSPRRRWARACILPTEGNVFLSVRDSDKPHCVEIARPLVSMGFTVFTTAGTHELLREHSVDTEPLPKISEGARPNILDKIANGEIQLIINTPTRKGGRHRRGPDPGDGRPCSASR